MLVLLVSARAAAAASAADLRRAEQLAWDTQFARSDALYRAILADDPRSDAARLGLARVVMWQGRYPEAIALFSELQGVEALEGKATAEYWSGDLRRAARDFRKVLVEEPSREFARRSLEEIAAVSAPSQRVSVDGVHDDQPLDAVRAEVAATFFSDPLTRWSVAAGGYRMDAAQRGDANGEYVLLGNETQFGDFTVSGSLGAFKFPDGVRRPIGGAHVRWRTLTLGFERREELATATSLDTHAASTITSLRWDYDHDVVAAAELNHRHYFDGNSGGGAFAYAVAPFRRNEWTLWAGASASVRDTRETRFGVNGFSEYDPYWTPEDLAEARAVVAIERRFARGSVKVHADGGAARDRGRDYQPHRAGISADFALAPTLRFEAGVERGVTIDYRSTTFHAALVRRR
jgi:hypothetical protein